MSDQIDQIRAWLAGDYMPEHETFTMGWFFAEDVIKEVDRLRAGGEASGALLREVLEALCERDGLSLKSSVEPENPARNYELAIRLGIGKVFGV